MTQKTNQEPSFFTSYREKVDERLNQILSGTSAPSVKLREAMTYSVLLGGKRVRPILTIATGTSFGAKLEDCLDVAAAVELIHAYSLIHDDLPSMDDDDLRRGQPTCHIAFDEATAILAGDALQTLAFETIAESKSSLAEKTRLAQLKTLLRASGEQGMVGGQAIDLHSVGQTLNIDELQNMHRLKTGALIDASVRLGALCAETHDAQDLANLAQFSNAIGLAFQIQDDILDVTSDTATLGKQQGADAELNKPTYPALLGLEGAKVKLQTTYDSALDALNSITSADTSPLEQIANYIIARSF